MLRLLARLALMGVLGGCSVTPSAPTPSDPTSTERQSVAPRATPAAPSPTTAPAWETGTIDEQFTTPLLDFRSTGTHLVWSTGAHADREADVAPDLYASEPGGTPRLIYDNPNRDSRLEYIDGVGTRIAFVELNSRAFGSGGWRLWYLANLDAAPLLVDEGQGDQIPFCAVSEDLLVWTAVHGNPKESKLLSLDLRSMARSELGSEPPDEVQFWFPDVDGETIVYGTVEPNEDFTSDERHVYLVADRQAPVRLDRGISASEPAIQGDRIVWKESDPRWNFLVAGSIVSYSTRSGVLKPLELPAPEGLGFVEPSVGNRYATAWPQSDRMAYVADLQAGTYPPILDLGPTNDDPHDAVARPHVAGNLLTYVFGPAAGDLELRWVILD